MFCAIYQGRRVLVTGHTGFKGSWISTWLSRLGAKVAGFSVDVPTSPANFEILRLEDKIAHHQGDIRDRVALLETFREFEPEIVFHLAAQALVRRSYGDPVTTFETNALGTMNVLECIRQSSSVRVAVIITSDKCYRNAEWVWGYRENDVLGGDDPYSASKGCAELIATSYMQSFFNGAGPNVATTRAGNVIGGGDWAADRIVPDCVRAWTGGKPVRIRSPRATRPWQHVLEPLSGYLWLGAKLWEDASGTRNEAFNFGPATDMNKTVAEMVEALAEHWPGFRWRMDETGCDAKHESRLLKLCCDKALAMLSWKSALDFPETISMTAEWYRSFFEGGGDMFDLTMTQISEYVAKAKARGLAWAQ